MIQKDIITNLVISKLTDTRYFLVDVTVSADNVIKVETKIDKKRIKCLRMNDFHFIKVINNIYFR